MADGARVALLTRLTASKETAVFKAIGNADSLTDKLSKKIAREAAGKGRVRSVDSENGILHLHKTVLNSIYNVASQSLF